MTNTLGTPSPMCHNNRATTDQARKCHQEEKGRKKTDAQEEKDDFASNRFINKIFRISIQIPVYAYNPDTELSFQKRTLLEH